MKLLKENETSANLAVANVMRISMIVLTVVFILNILGIFIVDMKQMTVAYAAGMALLFIPTLIVNILKKSSAGITKYICVSCAVIFTGILAVILPKHAILLYVYPIAISSLYFSGRLNLFSTVFTITAVTAAQIISFYIPCDKDANFTDFKGVVLFGAAPRAMILFAIAMIFTMLCKRTASLLGNLMSAEQQELIREKSKEISQTLVSTVTDMDGYTGTFRAVQYAYDVICGTKEENKYISGSGSFPEICFYQYTAYLKISFGIINSTVPSEPGATEYSSKTITSLPSGLM